MGRSSKAAKRPKLEIAPEEKHHVAELEDFLFGGGAAAKVLRPVAAAGGGGVGIAGGGGGSGSEDDELDIADLIREVGEGAGAESLLIVEDRAGEAPDPSLLRQTRRQRRAAAAAAAHAGAGAAEEASGEGEEGSEDDGSSRSEEEEGEGGAAAKTRGGGDGGAGPGPGSERDSEAEEGGPGRRRPVWVDPADADLRIDISSVARLRKLRTAKGQTEVTGATYEAALRRQHAAIHGGAANWAALPAAAGGARRRQRRAAWGDEEEEEGGSGSGSEGERKAGDEEAEAALLRSAGALLASRRRGATAAAAALPQGTLELSQLRDANAASPGDAVVRSVEFHPGGQLLLSAGFDKKLRLFAVDGVRNPLVQSVHLEDCPVQRAAFATGGGAVIAAGRRPFFYVVDLHAGAAERVLPPPGLLGGTGGGAAATGGGAAAAAAVGARRGRGRGGGAAAAAGAGSAAGGLKSLESFTVCNREDNPLVAFLGDGGHVGLLSLRGRQAVGSLKLNGSARAAAFTDDGTQLVAAGGDGVVYTFDLRTRRCLGAAVDEGSVGATALAVSGGATGGWLAAGSSSGVVNLYRRGGGGGLSGGASVLGGFEEEEGGLWGDSGGGGGFAAAAARASPFRALMQLTTSVDTLSFSRDGQLLLMASRMKKDALRVVHLPSGTVFSNWPTQTTPLHYVHCGAFSPGGGFMAVGNAKGRVLLYRLHHYGAA